MNPNESTCLDLLREKIACEDGLVHFKPFLIDDFLLCFIRGRKYKIDYALETLKQYFYLRQKKYRDFFLEITPSKLTFKHIMSKPLKTYGPDGQIIVVVKKEWFPTLEQVYAERISVDDALKVAVIHTAELLKDPNYQINGLEFILDLTHLKFAEVRYLLMQIHYAPKIVNLFHKAFPLRIRQINLVNPPKYVYWVIQTFLVPLDPAGYFDKVVMHHGDLKTLHERIPLEILPESFKGQLPEDEAYGESFHERALLGDEEFLKLHQCIKSSV